MGYDGAMPDHATGSMGPKRARPPHSQRPLRRLAFRLTAVSIGLFVVLLASEAAFRFADISPMELPPSDAAIAFRVNNEWNSLGLRAPEGFPPPRQAGEWRIAVLGDSMTYGEGVEPDQAFPMVMQELFRAGAPGIASRTCTVVNMGRLGDSPTGERARYLQLAERIDADLVLLVVYVNDFADSVPDPAEMLNRIYVLRDSLSWPAEYSRVWAYAERKIRVRMAYDETIRYYQAGARDGIRADAVAPVRAAVLALRDDVARRGGRLVVCMVPWLVRLSDYPLGEMHAAVAEMCRAGGVPYCDLLPAVEGQSDEAMRVSPGNHHPSVACHQRIAAYLARWLTDGGYLSK